MSLHNYTRTFANGSWDIDKTIEAEVRGALPGRLFRAKLFQVDLDFDFVDQLTGGEVATLNTVVADHISAAPTGRRGRRKRRRYREIDAKNEELIERGYLHLAIRFPLTMEFRTMLAGLFAFGSGGGAIAYPVDVVSRNSRDTLRLSAVGDLRALYRDAVISHRAIIDSGNVLKSQIRAATTLVDIDAVVDNR